MTEEATKDEAQTAETMIRLENLSKVFPGQDEPAVDDLSMDIYEGEIVVLVGPSGCGKTTTMKMVNRLIEPSSGRIFLQGEDVTKVNSDKLRRRIGYVIQQIGLFPHMTIADNIATVPKMLGWDKERTSRRIDELLETVGIDNGWIVYLGHTKPIDDAHKQYEAVAKEDLKKYGIEWLPPAPANNTYALAVRSEAVDKLGVTKLSDMKQLVQEQPDEATLCAASEFLSRDDGLPGLEKAYDFEFPNGNISELAEGPIYQATDQGDKCNFGEVFADDGRMANLDLTVIKDDKSFFPIYNPSLCVNKKTLEEYPQIEKIFAPINEKLTTEELQKLNEKVDVQGQLEDQVAEEWLKENGFI